MIKTFTQTSWLTKETIIKWAAEHNARISIWRIRAVGTTLCFVYALYLFCTRHTLVREQTYEILQLVFVGCWAISCLPQALDPHCAVLCALSKEERKEWEKPFSYWIANSFGLLTLLLLATMGLWVIFNALRK